MRCSRSIEVSRKSLEERYAELNGEALLERYSSGTLTELAVGVAREELWRRGIPLPQSPAPEPDAPAGPDLAMAGSLVAIAAKLAWFEANILCSLLHSEGIPARLADTHLATAHHFLSFAAGAIRILVPKRSVTRVREVISALQRASTRSRMTVPTGRRLLRLGAVPISASSARKDP